MHPNFIEMMEYAAAKGVKLGALHTNLALKVNMERLVAVPFAEIIVNIGGTSREVHETVIRRTNWDRVIYNLRALYCLRERWRRLVRVKMNVVKHNVHQVNNLPAFIENLGGKAEDGILGSTGFALPALASSEEKDEYMREVVSNAVKPHLRFNYDVEKDDFGIRAKAKFRLCRFLIPTVKFDGIVALCCHDQMDKLNMGNGFVDPLSRITDNNKYKLAWLRGFFKTFDFCKECN